MRRNSRSVPDLKALQKSLSQAADAITPEVQQTAPPQTSTKAQKSDGGTDTAQGYSRSESLPAGSEQKLDKPSERRRMHVMLEKRRRASMKERFDDLIRTVPLCNTRTRKVAILTKTVNYIKHLRQELDTITNDNYRLAETLRLRGVPTGADSYGNTTTQSHSPYRANPLMSASSDRYPTTNIAHSGHKALSPEPSLYNMGGGKAPAAFNFSLDSHPGNPQSGHSQRPGHTSPSVLNQSYDSFSPGVFGNSMGSLNTNMNVSLNSINEIGLSKLGAPKANLLSQQSIQSPLPYKGDVHRNLAGPGLVHSISVPDLQSMNKHRAPVSHNKFVGLNMNHGNNAYPQQQHHGGSGESTLTHMNSLRGDSSLSRLNSGRGDTALTHMNAMQSVISGEDQFALQRQESYTSQLPINFGISTDTLYPGNSFNVLGSKGNLETMDE